MRNYSTFTKLLFAVSGILLLNIPITAQEWDNMNPLDSLPETAPWRSRDDVLDFSSIVADPDIPGNNLLLINDFSGIERRGSFRYDWILNKENPDIPPEDLNEETGITIVFRAKPSTEAIQYEGNVVWMYISVRASGAISFQTDLEWKKDTLRFVGFNHFPPGGPNTDHIMAGDTSWHTFRVTQLKQDVKVYMDENPTPIFDGKTYGTDPGANHLRTCKQNRNAAYGGMFDYFLILEGAIYTPGEGPEIPPEFKVDGSKTAVKMPSANSSGLRVYPNPAGDLISIRVDKALSGVTTVDIFSITGQKVMTPYSQFLSYGDHQIRVNTQNLDPGIYILTANGKHARFVKK